MRARQEADCGAPNPSLRHVQKPRSLGDCTPSMKKPQVCGQYRQRPAKQLLFTEADTVQRGNLIPSKGFTDKLRVRLGNSYTQVTTPLPRKLLAGVSLRLPDAVRPRALREACLALSAADRPLAARGGPPPPPSSGAAAG